MDKPEETYKKTTFWKEALQNLLCSNKVCAICLSEHKELDHCDDIFYLTTEEKETTLEDIILVTFGFHVRSLLPTEYFCSDCVTTILRSYNLIQSIKYYYHVLENIVASITKHMNTCDNDSVKSVTIKEIFLTINNIDKLNVPKTLLESQSTDPQASKIFFCDIGEKSTLKPMLPDDQQVKFECPYCSQGYYNYTTLTKHLKNHNDKFYRCMKCLKRFKEFEDLIKHRAKQHLDVLSTCKVCKIILYGSERTEHISNHNTYSCNSCEKNFETEWELKRHNLDNYYEKCKSCKKTFTNPDKLLEHTYSCTYCLECKLYDCIHYVYLTSYLKQKLAGKKKFECPYKNCSYQYGKKNEIIYHANLMHFLGSQSTENTKKLTQERSQEVSNMQQDNDSDIPIYAILQECNDCKNVFSNKELFEEHVRSTQTCPECRNRFCHIDRLNEHIRNKHIPDKSDMYECVLCNIFFATKSTFVQHLDTHTAEDKKYTCKKCNKSFDSIEIHYVHVCKKGKCTRKKKECLICLKKYSQITLSRHLKLHFKDMQPPITCEVCGMDLINLKVLLNHSKKHSLKRQCSDCKKTVNSAVYTKHCDTHKLTEKLKQCSECDYKTKFTWCLDGHINRHHKKNRPYKCELCNRSFYSLYTLKGHSVTHKTERLQLHCQICSNNFKSKKALKLHLRLHTGEAPYPCEYCDLKFISASRRQQHVIRKHFEPSIQCSICKKMCYTQTALRLHVQNVHKNAEGNDRLVNEVIEEQITNNDEIIVLNDDVVYCS